MRRSAVLVLLLLCGVAVVFLLLQTGGNDSRAARRDGTRDTAALGADPLAADDLAAVESGGASGAQARDDDPNRVAGLDLVLRGMVVRDGVAVEGATVVAMRASPTQSQDYSPSRWAMYAFEMPPPPIATTVSKSDGSFELRIARRSRLMLRAFKSGSGAASLFLLMPAEGDPPEVTLKLRPCGKIEGIVVDEKAAPVEGVDVTLGTQDWMRPVTETAAKTDAEGRFVLEDVPDGSYRIRAQAAGYPEARLSVWVPMQRFVRIDLLHAGIITGTVTDGRGAAVAGARVMLTTSSWERTGASGAAKAETDAAGVYRVEIYPGSVQSALVDHPRVGRHVAGDEGFDLPIGLVEAGKELKYDIKLKPGVVVRGRAVYEGTLAPASGASIALLRLARQWRGMNEVAASRADDDGRFEFPYVTEGTYALEAKAEKGARLANRYAQANQRVTIDFFVDGEASPPEQRLELLATGGVKGRLLGVAEAEPNQRPNIYLQTAQGYSSATVDDLGAYEMVHVPPMEEAVLQANNPQAKSDPFRVEAGKVALVDIDARKQGITGVVEDETGRPVARARVQICPQGQLQHYLPQFTQNRGWGGALTDEQGRFSLSAAQWSQGFGNQKFVAFAARDGYAVTLGADAFELPQEGKEAPGIRLVLRKGGFVRGRVEHAGGAPAINISVTVSPKPEPNPQGQNRPDPAAPPDTRSTQTAYTGFDGRFEVNGVADGVYLVSAYHPLGKVESREVRAGEEMVKLVIEPALAIGGVVVTEGGKPVSGAMVAVVVPKERGETMQQGQTGVNGRFRVGQIAAGSYAVEVSANQQPYGGTASGFEKKRVEGIVAGTEDLVITVSEGKGLRGRVEDQAGKPVAGAGVMAMAIAVEQPAQPGGRPRQRGGQANAPSAVTNGRGEFEIQGLGPAEVEVLAVADGYTPASQRAVAGCAPVTLRLDGGSVIEGRVLKTDGRPVGRQYLWLQPTSKETQQRMQDWQERGGQAWSYLGGYNMQSGMTDGEGKFRFSSLLPGEYRVQMQMQGQAVDEVLPATMLQTGAPPVTLRLERALTIKGRIVGPDGQAVVLPVGQMAQVSARRAEQWFPGAMVGGDGRFELRGLPAGTVTLHIWAGNEYKQAQVDVVSGTDGVLITLEKNPPPQQPTK